MKVEKLKHPFLLKAIVAIFGQIYIYIYRKREFGIKYSFKKIFFTNWQKQKKNHSNGGAMYLAIVGCLV